MTRLIAYLARLAAVFFDAFDVELARLRAERRDQVATTFSAEHTVTTTETDIAAADRIIGELQFRDALRRFSPRERPGQA